MEKSETDQTEIVEEAAEFLLKGIIEASVAVHRNVKSVDEVNDWLKTRAGNCVEQFGLSCSASALNMVKEGLRKSAPNGMFKFTKSGATDINVPVVKRGIEEFFITVMAEWS